MHRALVAVRVNDCETEARLSEPRAEHDRPTGALAAERLERPVRGRPVARRALQTGPPQALPLALGQVVPAPRHDVARPVRWCCDPFVGREEDRFGDSDAADDPVEPVRRSGLCAEPLKAKQKVVLIAGPVGLTEHIPRPPQRQPSEAGEKPEAANRVVACLELEEERLARLQRRKASRAWPPEVDLLNLRTTEQELVPALVGGCDEATHVARIFHGHALMGKEAALSLTGRASATSACAPPSSSSLRQCLSPPT